MNWYQTSDREIRPSTITFGRMPIHKKVDGFWYDNETGEKVQTIETTMGKLLDEQGLGE